MQPVRLIGAGAIAAVIAALSVGFGSVDAGATPPGYVAKSALINGDTVTHDDGILKSGVPISLEQYAAEKAGYKVTVVTGAAWDAMTTAQFAKYQLLIVGDPDCSSLATSVTSDASTWAPLVMGKTTLNHKVGNRALVGTDPEDHYAAGGGGAQPTDPSNPSTAGAEHLVQSGITFAGQVAGATGIYFDSSCDGNSDMIATLNRLSASGTGFTQNTDPPCGGSVQLIASNPAFTTLTDSDIQGWECSDHITFPTYPVDWQPLAVATDTASHPTCGTDPFTKSTACGEAYVLVSGTGLAVTAPDLTLTPGSHTDVAGPTHTHTVTATVTSVVPSGPSSSSSSSSASTPPAVVTQGAPTPGTATPGAAKPAARIYAAAPYATAPVVGQLVSFQVTGTNVGVTGTCAPASCMTNASGKVTFTYADKNGAGADTINASTTISGTTEHATATETWKAAPASSSASGGSTSKSSSNPPVANTGARTSHELRLAFALFAFGAVFLIGGVVRRPRGRRES